MDKCIYYKDVLFAQSNLRCVENRCFIDLKPCNGKDKTCMKYEENKKESEK